MRFSRVNSRVLAAGLVCAMAGFCLAVSTNVAESAGQVCARAVGSVVVLQFTNPLVPGTTEYDLGDASFGSSTSIARYITAEGGVRPYRFTSTGNNSLQNAIEGTYSSLQLGLSGLLAGTAPYALPPSSVTVLGTPGLRFQVTVQDSRGTNPSTLTSYFNLFLVNSTGATLKFAIDKLPTALLASSYAARLDVIGGKSPLTFSMVSVTGVSSLSDLGLSLSSDGVLIGRPLKTGTYVVTVRAVDSKGLVATNRSGTTIDQAFSLVILDNPIASSDLLTLSCGIRGDNSSTGRDTLKYSGVINVLGQDNFDLLNSDFSFRLGGLSVAGRLDQKGELDTFLSDGSPVKVKVIPGSGKVEVTIEKSSFITALGTTSLIDGALTRKVVQVSIGDAVTAGEVLDFETGVKASKYQLNYKYGKDGAAPAGGFQITSVMGFDKLNSSGQPGDQWRVRFLAAPRVGVASTSGAQGLNNVSALTVRIGTNFTQTLAGLKSTDKNVSFRAKGDGVRKFQLNTETGAGKLDTGVLRTTKTEIPLAYQSPAFSNVFFPMGLDITRIGASFNGEHARRIFGLKFNYRDVPPKR
jgi:hypothetical protein